MAVLKIRDENGNIIEIPSIKGDKPIKGVDYWNETDKAEVQGFIDNSVLDLENLLRDILVTIQAGGTTSSTIEEIEQLIVSYFETKTVEEVEY
jgi:hypothetical protein